MSEKSGGFINRLIVTCVRSGLNRPFRVLQKPERAPIRALRASSSGRLTSYFGSCLYLWLLVRSSISCVMFLGLLKFMMDTSAEKVSLFILNG